MSQKLRISIVAVFIATAAVLSVGGALAVRAKDGTDDSTTTQTTTETETENSTSTTENETSNTSGKDARLTELQERVQGKLDDAKKKVCNARVTAIKRIMTNAAAAGQRHEEVFTKILTRIEDFYTNKKLTVANYDALVAAANAKKAAADTAIADVKNNVTFDCSSDNPVGTADAFNGKVKAMHTALQNYRKAINDLLVAVKQAAETAEKGAQQ